MRTVYTVIGHYQGDPDAEPDHWGTFDTAEEAESYRKQQTGYLHLQPNGHRFALAICQEPETEEDYQFRQERRRQEEAP